MPKRKSVPLLEKLCLENVVKNMERLWVKRYGMDDSLDRGHSRDMKVPFSMLAGSVLQELLNIMRERKLLTPAILLLLVLPQLKELNLKDCSKQVGRTIAHIISVRCKNLTSLILNGCDQIPADALVDLVKALPHLRKLSLAATQCNTKVLSTMRTSCPGLNELDITNCKRLTPDSLLFLAYDPITGSYCCQALQKLTAEGLIPRLNCPCLLWGLTFVLLALPSLKYLNHHATVQAVYLIHDQQFFRTQMPVGFPSLEEVARYRASLHPNEESSRLTLGLKKIYGVLDSFLPKVVAVCPHLLEVSVVLRESRGLDQRLLPLGNLIHLNIGGGERDLRELLPVTACLGTQLKRLIIEGFTFENELTFHTLLSHCPNLLKFEFFFHSPVEYGLERQPENEAINWDLSLPPLHFPELSEFTIMYIDIRNPLPSRHVAVMNNILVSVFKYSPFLKTLTLLCLPFSLDEAFKKVLKPTSTALPHLHQLSLVEAQISVGTINLLFTAENQLSILSLAKCLNINKKDYTELLQKVHNENFELVIKWK